MPDTTYAIASPTVIRMPNSFWAPANRALEVRTYVQEEDERRRGGEERRIVIKDQVVVGLF
jgi:hypothetical protein